MTLTTTEEMKRKFNSKLCELISNKACNSGYLSNEKYVQLKNEIKELKRKDSRKTPSDYQKLKRFDLIKIGDNEKLIYPVSDNSVIKYYITNEDLFDIIHDVHLSIGHGGRNRMAKEIKRKFKNVTKETIMLYLNLCEICQKKFKVPKKDLVAKPIIFSEMNSRCQVDLIDMQSQEDQGFKFILVYQDHLTKFIQLRPLRTKTAEEVAYTLLDIFTIFGAPSVLQSDNGREFSNRVIEKVCSMWSELKIVHGKPYHNQSQGSVECINQNVENIISTWLQTHKTTYWSDGLRFVQFMKNRTYHKDIKCSPYEAMFGQPVKIGLKSSNLPREVLQSVRSEEDLEEILRLNISGDSKDEEDENKAQGEENLSSNEEDNDNEQDEEDENKTQGKENYNSIEEDNDNEQNKEDESRNGRQDKEANDHLKEIRKIEKRAKVLDTQKKLPQPSITYAQYGNIDISLPAVGATFETTVSHSLRQKTQNNSATEELTKNSFDINMYLDESAKDKQSLKPQSAINFSACKLKDNQSTCELAKHRSEEPVAKRRKINIISPGIDSYFSAPSTSSLKVPESNSVQNFTQNDKDMKDDKKALGKQYLKDVKRALSASDYKIFASMIQSYTQSGDFDELLKTLSNLFPPTGLLRHLFIGFQSFLKKQHIATFENYISCHTPA